MPTIKYQFLSERETHSVSVLDSYSEVITCEKVKFAISKRHALLEDELDLVDLDNGLVIADQDLIDHTRKFDVMKHSSLRIPPPDLQSEAPDISDESITEPRVRMSCRHGITPSNLYTYMRVTLMDGIPKVSCFECQKEWEFDEISTKSIMSKDEKIFWGAKISLNSLNGGRVDTTNCPRCHSLCQRIDTNNKAVRCPFCEIRGHSFDFCWECKETWSARHRCRSLEETQILLEECERITVGYSNIESVPSVRVCPSCGAVIHHEGGCKQMTCSRCNTSFCFSCLTLCHNGHLRCTAYNEQCPVAPIQRLY